LTGEPEKHWKDILEGLREKGGLDYLPRERTPEGRLYEHASECQVLFGVLIDALPGVRTKILTRELGG